MTDARSALRLLLGLKLRAFVRATRRRASTPSGLLFGAIGLALVGLWIATLALRGSAGGSRLDDAELEIFVRGVLLLLAGFGVLGSFSHRGLYLPGAELERLLSAPVPRADLVRFRMIVGVARGFTFALITALVFSARLPGRPFAIPGLMLAMLTMPILSQGAALLLGGAENRFARIARLFPVGLVRITIAVAFWLIVMVIFFRDEIALLSHDLLPRRFDPLASRAPWEDRGPVALLAEPWMHALTAPAAPWAAMVVARDWGEFLLSAGFCAGLWVAMFEGIARLPIDFRELSLETSADIARRLARLRAGRSLVGGTRVSKRALGWRVPWLFGRGPFGAVAWLKTCAIIRKARGTLVFYGFVIGVLTLVSLAIGREGGDGAEQGGALIAVLGTIYLGMGLRFDFRSDLDLLERMKAWPLAGWRIFLATILPEVGLISLLVGVSVLARCALAGAFPPIVLAWIGAVPLVALLWTALDNAVFLWAPVRYAPGQSSSMQYAGRSMLLVIVRLALLGALAITAFVAMMGTRWVALRAGLEFEVAQVAGGVVGGLVVLVAIALVIALGGRAFQRFDVSRPVQ